MIRLESEHQRSGDPQNQAVSGQVTMALQIILSLKTLGDQ